MDGTPREMIKKYFGICFRHMNARHCKRFNEFRDFDKVSADRNFKRSLAMRAHA